MLVLTRKTAQTIELPELGITVKVIQTGKGSCKIGVAAPPSVRIVRGEIAAKSTKGTDHLCSSK